MSSTTAGKTIQALCHMFASHGLPEQLVTDNGPQFISDEFDLFMKSNGIRHIRSTPYHPSTNGEAERFIQTFKRSMKTGKACPGSLELHLHQFLLSYRSTPHTTTGITPAELFLKRRLQTRLDLLRPQLQSHVTRKQALQKEHHDGHSRSRDFEAGQVVLAKNFQ